MGSSDHLTCSRQDLFTAFDYSLFDGPHHTLPLIAGEIGIDRHGGAAPIGVFGMRKISLAIAKRLLVIRMEVQRNEVHTRANAQLLEMVDKPSPVKARESRPQPKNKEMPGMLAAKWRLPGQLKLLNPRESFQVELGELMPRL